MPPFLKSCCSTVPQRWIFVAMGFLAFVNAYNMRVCLTTTIGEMVIATKETRRNSSDETCRNELGIRETDAVGISTSIRGEGVYDWNEDTQEIILSSYYWGYLMTHLPGAWLAEKSGGKLPLMLSIFFSSVSTLLTPLSVQNCGPFALIVLRVLTGLASGPIYPAATVLLSRWIAPEERSTAGSLVFGGAALGTAFANLASDFTIRRYGWPWVFYCFGSLGLAWCVFFSILCYDHPGKHPCISEREAEWLEKKLGERDFENQLPPMPWSHVLSSAPVWAATAGNVGNALGYRTIIGDLPKYMSDVLKFSIRDDGPFLGSLPHVCMWLGSLGSARIFDWLIYNEYLGTTSVRKIGVTASFIGPGIFLIAASYAGCSQLRVIIFFILGMTLMGCSLSSIRVNLLDLSPNYAGWLMAFTNGAGVTTGIVTPYLVALLTPNRTLGEWRRVFWIVFSVFSCTNFIFLVYGSGKVQRWNNTEFLRRERHRRLTDETLLPKLKA